MWEKVGGFGLAKGVVLGRPKQFKLVTVAPDRTDGKTYKITMNGTGDGWKQYAKDFLTGRISSDKLNPDFAHLDLNPNLSLDREEVPDSTPKGSIYALKDDSFNFGSSSGDKFRVMEKGFNTKTVTTPHGDNLFKNLGTDVANRVENHPASTVQEHEKPFTSQFNKLTDNPNYHIECCTTLMRQLRSARTSLCTSLVMGPINLVKKCLLGIGEKQPSFLTRW